MSSALKDPTKVAKAATNVQRRLHPWPPAQPLSEHGACMDCTSMGGQSHSESGRAVRDGCAAVEQASATCDMRMGEWMGHWPPHPAPRKHTARPVPRDVEIPVNTPPTSCTRPREASLSGCHKRQLGGAAQAQHVVRQGETPTVPPSLPLLVKGPWHSRPQPHLTGDAESKTHPLVRVASGGSAALACRSWCAATVPWPWQRCGTTLAVASCEPYRKRLHKLCQGQRVVKLPWGPCIGGRPCCCADRASEDAGACSSSWGGVSKPRARGRGGLARLGRAVTCAGGGVTPASGSVRLPMDVRRAATRGAWR